MSESLRYDRVEQAIGFEMITFCDYLSLVFLTKFRDTEVRKLRQSSFLISGMSGIGSEIGSLPLFIFFSTYCFCSEESYCFWS